MSLDRTITIERFTEARDQFGAITKEWAIVQTMRAKVVQGGASEQLMGAGLVESGVITFRTRFLRTRFQTETGLIVGFLTTDRLTFEGRTYDIKDIREIGRHRGLEIRAQRKD